MGKGGCLSLLALVVIAGALVAAFALVDYQARPEVVAARARTMAARAEREEIRAEIARETAPAAIRARQALYMGGGLAGAVLIVGGAGALVFWLWRRANLVYPTGQGQYPLVRVNGRGWSALVDAGRAPSHVTVIAAGQSVPQVAAPQTLSEGAHVALAGQAAGVAAIAAASRHENGNRAAMAAAATLIQPTDPYAGRLGYGATLPEPEEPEHKLLEAFLPAGQDVVEGEVLHL